MDEKEELLGAAAVHSDPGPPAWLKMLQDRQAQQFQQLLTPVLQHVTAGQRATTRAMPTVPSNQTQYAGVIPPSTLEAPEQPSIQMDTPFAAELEVIRQRSHNAGPPTTSTIHDPAVRCRDERMPQRSAPARMTSHDTYGTHGNSGNRHNML